MNVVLSWKVFDKCNYRAGDFVIERCIMDSWKKYIFELCYLGKSGRVISFDIDYLFAYAEAVNQGHISWMDHYYP